MEKFQLTFPNTIYHFQETFIGAIEFIFIEMLNLLLTYFQ